jgi:hypothetical protein
MATTTFVDHLFSLRGQYMSLLDDESSSTLAREQLSHVNALLVDQLLPGSGKTVSKTVVAEAPIALPTAAAPKTRRGGRVAGRTAGKTAGKTVGKTAGKTTGRVAKAKVAKPKGTVGSRIKLTMADEYQGLSKIDAVGKIMESNRNQIVHMNDIIYKMFGELDDKEMKAEQMRMKDTLIRGVRRGLWQKAKGVPLSYFLGSLPAGAKAAASKTSAASKTKAAPKTRVSPKRKVTSPLTKTKAAPKAKAKATTGSKLKPLSGRKKAVPARKGGRVAKK